MPAYNFKARFAHDVEAGTKRQTIRRCRKRPTRPGEMLQLYTGMRTKSCRLLTKARCQSIQRFSIDEKGRISVEGAPLTGNALQQLAGDDGFDDVVEFVQFFKQHYGLPFEGEIIKW